MKKISIIFVGLLFLAAGVNAKSITKTPEQLVATHGYVYFNAPLIDGVAELVLAPSNGKGSFPLLLRNEEKSYGGWLPTGEYKILTWNGNKWGDYDHISVKAGQVTNLGSFIFAPIGGYEYVVLPMHLSEFESGVSVVANEFKNILASPEIIQWAPTQVPVRQKFSTPSTGLGLVADLMNEYDRKVNKPAVNKSLQSESNIDNFFAIIKSSATPITEMPGVDNLGNLYYGADFGQLRVHEANGGWNAIDTQTLRVITAVGYGEGELVVAYIDGSVRTSSDEGKTWKLVKKFENGEVVKDFDFSKGVWTLITGRYDISRTVGGNFSMLKNFAVYVSNKNDFFDLKPVFEKPYTDVGFFELRGEISGDHFYFLFYPDLYSMDMKTFAVQKITPPKAVNGFHSNANNGIVASWAATGMFSKLYLSTDAGVSWKELNTPPYTIQDIYFSDETNGTAVRFASGMWSATPEKNIYDKSKNKWKKVSEGVPGCVKFLRDAKNFNRFCVMPGGNIFEEDQESGKWSLVYRVD